MAYENLLWNVEDGVGVLTFHRPKVLNAMNVRTIEELDEAIAVVERDPAVRAVVLTGAGEKAFIAGADIAAMSTMTPAEAGAFAERAHGVLARLGRLRVPTVAAVNGYALGGGCEVALACDLVYASENARFGQPEVNLGIIPGYGGTQRLPRLVGVERALELLRTGRTISAREACGWGWARGEPAEDPVAAAKALVREHLAGTVRLAPVDPAPVPVPERLPPVDLGHRSLAIDEILVDVVVKGLALPLREGLAVESRGFGRCKRTVDMDIGMKNFIQNGPRVPAVFLHE